MKRMWKWIKRAEKLFLKFLNWSFRFLPVGFIRLLGEFLWRSYYHTSLRRRVRATERIAIALGMGWREADEVLKDCLRNIVFTFVEFVSFPRFKRKGLWRLVEEVRGFENLKRAAEMGRGIVAVTAHYGNWEFLGAWLVDMGYTLVAPGKRQTTEEANEIIETVRKTVGIKLLWKGSTKNSYLKELKKGNVVGLVADQYAGKDGVPVKFFGRETTAHVGPIFLSALSGAPILPMYAERVGFARFVIHIGKPFVVERPVSAERAKELVREYVRSFEEVIEKNPSQWLWLHNRWKNLDGVAY